jgi:hypothetical protein
MKRITICITTHCIKKETRGPWKGIPNVCPSAPSTKMIEDILSDFFSKTDITLDDCHIHIGFDKRKGRSIDEEYQNNLNILCERINGKLLVNESEIDDPIETAPINFSNVINSVETEYYFLLEHDWIFTRSFSFKSIIEEMDKNDKINLIRFSQHETVMKSALHPDNDVSESDILSIKVTDNIPVLPSCHFSNNPYICKTKVFKDWWSYLVFPTPEMGGFVEGPMNIFFKFTSEKVGWINTMKAYKCFVYGDPNDSAWVQHLNGNVYR